MNTRVAISLSLSAILIAVAFWFTSARPGDDTSSTLSPAVSIIEGKQIIDISAKGGYSPRRVVAKAGIPTVLRVTTKGTFDCSSSLLIPKLSYQKSLQPSGIEEIAISAGEAQGTLQGLCAMGMYNFQIKFQ